MHRDKSCKLLQHCELKIKAVYTTRSNDINLNILRNDFSSAINSRERSHLAKVLGGHLLQTQLYLYLFTEKDQIWLNLCTFSLVQSTDKRRF